MRTIKTLGLLGTGVIGGGWAARALHGGYDVLAYDIKPEMEAVLMRSLEVAAEGHSKINRRHGCAAKGTLRFTTDLDELAAGADFIQENVPEVLEIKQSFSALAEKTDADVLISLQQAGLCHY